jgi:DNA-binding GntR family transcriptional regulator
MERKTHTQTIRMTLEDDIFSGRLLPGEVLDEETLAQRFNVSRTPVREAMLQLTQSGLVEKGSRRSARVKGLDVYGLIQVFEVISEFEGLCARFAARRASEKELEALKQNNALAAEKLNEGNEEEYGRLGREFHYLVIKAAHNEFLADHTNKLALHTRPFRRFQLGRKGRMEDNHLDHEAILEALVNRDEEAAFQRMRGHIVVQGSTLADYIAIVNLKKTRDPH